MNITPLRSKHFTVDFKNVHQSPEEALLAAAELRNPDTDSVVGYVSARACGNGQEKLYFALRVHSKRTAGQQQAMIKQILAYRNLRLLEYRTVAIQLIHQRQEVPSAPSKATVRMLDAMDQLGVKVIDADGTNLTHLAREEQQNNSSGSQRHAGNFNSTDAAGFTPEHIEAHAQKFDALREDGIVGDSISVPGTQQGITAVRVEPNLAPFIQSEQMRQKGEVAVAKVLSTPPDPLSDKSSPSTPTTLWGRIRQAARRLFKR